MIVNNRTYLIPNWPAPKNIRAYTTIRENGFSKAPFDSFNLADYVNDDLESVNANRKTLIDDLQLPNSPLWLQQVHGCCVVRAEEHHSLPVADASFTQRCNTVCAVLIADCLPILICNRDGTEVAAIHAGWKGLLANVINTTIKTMHTPPDDLMAWMGPAISQEYLKLNNRIHADFLNANPDYSKGFRQIEQSWHLDCYSIGKMQLHQTGVNMIYGGGFCTFKDKKRFYSYRRDNRTTGRMTSLIFIEG